MKSDFVSPVTNAFRQCAQNVVELGRSAARSEMVQNAKQVLTKIYKVGAHAVNKAVDTTMDVMSASMPQQQAQLAPALAKTAGYAQRSRQLGANNGPTFN